MKESSILFKLSSSSNTGWKYSWRLLNKGCVGGDGGSGVVLAIDSLVCCSPSIAAVFVAAAVALDDDEVAVIV